MCRRGEAEKRWRTRRRIKRKKDSGGQRGRMQWTSSFRFQTGICKSPLCVCVWFTASYLVLNAVCAVVSFQSGVLFTFHCAFAHHLCVHVIRTRLFNIINLTLFFLFLAALLLRRRIRSKKKEPVRFWRRRPWKHTNRAEGIPVRSPAHVNCYWRSPWPRTL